MKKVRKSRRIEIPDGYINRKEAAVYLNMNTEFIKRKVANREVNLYVFGNRSFLKLEELDVVLRDLEERRKLRVVWERRGDIV